MKRTVLVIFMTLSIFLMLSITSNAQAYFESNVLKHGNWGVKSSWTLVSGTDSDSIPDTDDDVQILNGDSIDVNVNSGCHHLTIGQGVNGQLGLGTNSSIVFTVTGNVLISANARFVVNRVSWKHTMYVSGNFTNNNLLEMYYDNVTYCEIYFNGNTNQTIDGIGSFNNFYNINIVNTGGINNNLVEFKPSFINTKGNDDLLVISSGYFKVSGSFNYTGHLFRLSPFFPANGGFWLDNPNVTITGKATNCSVYGLFRLTKGNFYCGINNTNNFEFQSGSKMLLEGGNLYIGSKFRGTNQSQTVDFEMTGGTMTVGYYGNLNQNFGTFDINTPGSSFTLTGGTIYIKNENTNSVQPVDYRNLSGTVNVTGGQAKFGDPALPGTPSYVIASGSTPTILPTTELVKSIISSKLILSGNINVHGNFLINSGTTLEQKGHTINLIGHNIGGPDPGNWEVGGTHFYDTSLVIFSNKLADQYITQTSKFKRLTIDKDIYKLIPTIGTDTLRVDSILTMSGGNIECAFKPMILGKQTLTGLLNYSKGNVFGEFIRWIYTTGEYAFPVGNSGNTGLDTSFEMVTITLNNLTPGTIKMSFQSNNPGENGFPLTENSKTLDHLFTEGFWKLNSGNGFGSSDFDLKLRSIQFDSYTFDADSRIVRRNNNGNWQLGGNHISAETNPKIAKRQGFNQFGEFGIAHTITSNCNYPDVPTIYTANNSICPGDNVELNIESGNLNDAADWYWYKDSCGGTFMGTGSTISDNPLTTTTYYVRGEGNCVQNGPCSAITITAEDLINPSITCPPDMTIYVNGEICANSANYEAIAEDNCTIDEVIYSIPSGSNFIPGNYVITATAYDVTGNSSSCTFNLNVIDNENPILYCPSNIYKNNDSQSCGSVCEFTADAFDNCQINDIQFFPASGSSFNVGQTLVTTIATDASGNSSSCTFEVNIVDNEIPVILCPQNIIQNADPNECSSIVNFNATANDNCGINTLQYSHPSGTSFNVGQTLVTVTVSDIHGNSNTCSFEVEVIDNQVPVITCPATILQNVDPNECSAIVNFNATANDNCGLNTIQYSQNSGTLFNVGQTLVTATASDIHGNSSTCTFEVEVIDNQAPDITCPGTINQNVDASECSAIVNFSAAANDNCGINTIQYSQDSGTSFNVGQTLVTATASDIHGNSSTCTFEVEITDNELPVINCPQNQSRTIITPHVQYITLGSEFDWINKSDNCTISSTSFTLTGSTVDTGFETIDTKAINLGNTLVNWTTTDNSGNSINCNFNIEIVQIQQLDIQCIGDQNRYTQSTNCHYTSSGSEFDPISYQGGNQLSYVLSGATTGSGQQSLSGIDFNKGNTNVVWTVSDNQGNFATCSFTINITDNINPVIVCKPNQIKNTNFSCVHSITGTYFDLTSFYDNCNIDSVVYQLSGATAGIGMNTLLNKTLSKGITLINWMVKDVSGNSSTCSFSVTVNDSVKPTVKTKNAKLYLNNGGNASLSIAMINNGSYDNCTINNLSLSKTNFQCIDLGNNVCYLTVTDGSGNVSSASAIVSVQDTLKPTAKCKNTIAVLQNGTKTILPIALDNNSKDNCAIQSYSCSKTTFTCADAGKNDVYLTVTDASGNTSSCLSVVTVNYAPLCSIELKPSNNIYTGGIPNNIYLGYGPQSVQMKCVAIGGSGFSYSWSPITYLQNPNSQSPSFVPIQSGNYSYTVTVTNSNGCTSTSSVTFCVDDIRVANSNPARVYLCHNGQTKEVLVSNVASHVPGHNGDVLGKCNEGCNLMMQVTTDKRKPQEINLNDLEMNSVSSIEYEIYPNPTRDEFIINSVPVNSKIKVYNTYGQLMDNFLLTKNTSTSFGAAYPNAVYYIILENSLGLAKYKLLKTTND